MKNNRLIGKLRALIIAIALYSLTASAQAPPQSDVVNITMPKRAIKLTKEQANNYEKEKFKLLKPFEYDNNNYNIDGIIVSFYDLMKMDDPELTLSLQKLSTDKWMKQGTGVVINESKIITLNGIPFFIFEYQQGDEVSRSFTSDFRKNKTIYCMVYYKKEDEVKGKAIFNEILNTVHYKN